MWLGTFVCEEYAEKHKEFWGGNKEAYCKPIEGEFWDPYQLRSVALGGNKPFYDMLKSNDILKADFEDKYKHKAVLFYR